MSRSLKYSLEKWNFKKNTYYGSVMYRGDRDLRDIFLDEGCPLTEKEMGLLIQRVGFTIQQLLSEGYAICMDNMLRIQPVIKGIFYGDNDEFDPMRHSVEVDINPGMRLRELHRENGIKIRKVDGYRREDQ